MQFVDRDVLVLGFRGQTGAHCVHTGGGSNIGRGASLRLYMG